MEDAAGVVDPRVPCGRGGGHAGQLERSCGGCGGGERVAGARGDGIGCGCAAGGGAAGADIVGGGDGEGGEGVGQLDGLDPKAEDRKSVV